MTDTTKQVEAAAAAASKELDAIGKEVSVIIRTAPSRVLKFFTLVLLVLLIVGSVFFACSESTHTKRLVELQNEVAKRDQTIEVQKDVYAKLNVAVHDAKSALDTSQADVKRLAAELKKTGADLLSVQNVVVKLKKQIAEGEGHQHNLPVDPAKPGDPVRTQVDFSQDFGFVTVSGWTVTNPARYQLALGPGTKPLRLTLAVTQQKDKSWRTVVASSDPNVALEIGAAAVNPFMLQERWYEKLKVAGDLGAGDGVLAGVGALVPVGRFEFGPHIWWTSKAGAFYGGSGTWAPFKKGN